MKISKTAVSEFQRLINRIKRDFPVKKDGTVRSNLSYRKRLKIGGVYNAFVRDLVSREIRPLEKHLETVDVTKLWIPHELLKELEILMCSVNSRWIFFTPEDTKKYKVEIVDRNVVIFGNDIIVPQRRR